MKKSSEEKRLDIYFEAMVKGEITEQQYKDILENKAYVNGARVRIRSGERIGEYATICDARPKSDSYGVEHETPMRGHNCDGKCEHGYGWYYSKSALELI